ncbi:sulfatase [Haloferax volcanii]|uniref:Sulfatase n=1 Tax=Haloferax volcanii JCM 10717 TaxID=1227458 RepID=M0HTT5_HALVO|nr:sulfatase [Haloferax alexandrinus]ELZ87911.1 sulfatase [Haloferax alexandrinus JCM 10717]
MKPNIVLVIADCLRRDRIGCYGYDKGITPTLDSLASKGIQYNDTISTGSWTVPAHGSLFSGMYPSENGAHAKNKSFPIVESKTLAGQLTSSGYQTVGFSTNPWITPEFGFASGFDDFYNIKPTIPFDNAGNPKSFLENTEFETVFQRWGGIANWLVSGNPAKRAINGLYQKLTDSHPIPTAETVLSRMSAWKEESAEQPFFMFVNFMDVHEPYRLHDEYLEGEFGSDDIPDIKWNLSSLDQDSISKSSRSQINEIYDASVQYLDDQINSLLTWLESTGDLDNTIVIVGSDHGQSLGEQGFWGHGSFLQNELVKLPLIVSAQKEYLNRWPSSSMTISLAELPYYILNSFNEKFDSNSSIVENSAETKLQGNNYPVLVESHGPHEAGDFTGKNISNEGYRSVWLSNQYSLRNLEEETMTVNLDGSDYVQKKQVYDEFVQYEDEIMSGLEKPKEMDSVRQIEGGTKERLEDLGYM